MENLDCYFELVILSMKKVFSRAAVLSAVFFLLNYPALSKDVLLLNTGRDRVYVFSPETLKVKAEYGVCEKQASCTDIVPLGDKNLVVLHRIDFNVDAMKVFVYDRCFKKLIRTIKVDKSPYLALRVDRSHVLINHTFLSYETGLFTAELLNKTSLKVERIFHLKGIPVRVIDYNNEKYAVLEDVRGVVGGVELKSLSGKDDIVLKSAIISSNVVSVDNELYCAVNGYGVKGYRNVLLKLTYMPLMIDNNVEVKVLKRFKTPFPFILATYKGMLIIGFTNHSIKGNFNKLEIYQTGNGKAMDFNICYGPESAIVTGDLLIVGCVSDEKVAVINLKDFKLRIVRISDAVPGFTLVRMAD